MKIARAILALTLVPGLLSACSSTQHGETPGHMSPPQQPCLKKTADGGTETDGGIGGTGQKPEACSEAPDPT